MTHGRYRNTLSLKLLFNRSLIYVPRKRQYELRGLPEELLDRPLLYHDFIHVDSRCTRLGLQDNVFIRNLIELSDFLLANNTADINVSQNCLVNFCN